MYTFIGVTKRDKGFVVTQRFLYTELSFTLFLNSMLDSLKYFIQQLADIVCEIGYEDILFSSLRKRKYKKERKMQRLKKSILYKILMN